MLHSITGTSIISKYTFHYSEDKLIFELTPSCLKNYVDRLCWSLSVLEQVRSHIAFLFLSIIQGWQTNEGFLLLCEFLQALVLKYLLFVLEDDMDSDLKCKPTHFPVPPTVGTVVHSNVLDSRLVFSHAQRTRYKFLPCVIERLPT